MKNANNQQEILLVTSSAFMQKELCDNDVAGNNLSAAEKLEAACWNGMLKDWSWGSFARNKKAGKMFLWRVFVADKILCVQASKAPASVDRYYSIDPYLFIDTLRRRYN